MGRNQRQNIGRNLMGKSSAHKEAARAYQEEHPGTTFPDALRATKPPPKDQPYKPDGIEVTIPHWEPGGQF